MRVYCLHLFSRSGQGFKCLGDSELIVGEPCSMFPKFLLALKFSDSLS